ncbi:hypothetical protein NEDG_00573 [Nematocida displodere]|uniref:Uncharacterized protein n=1 Tax=Nematocida displodere TaxID=1805483 RepID=A0A177EDH5_9MICR|nr:hypothetical protein NEDG_00573 [Nematocida displodere]
MKKKENRTGEQRRIELLKNLPLDYAAFKDVLENNAVKNLEANLYGRSKDKEEKLIYKTLRSIGIRTKTTESLEKRVLVLKLKKHMRFVMFQIDASLFIQ